LEALAERTGTEPGELRLMTVGGWVPWLADTLDASYGCEAFHTYARQDSVLLRPGEAGVNHVQQWRPWFCPDRPDHRGPGRICPVCAGDPDRGTPLTATIPLMLSCPEHGCLLEAETDITIARFMERPTPQRTAPRHVLALDRLTHEGLTTGTVTLPRRPVHVGVWFRLLRTLLDEVSISTSRTRRHSTAALEQIWDTTGRPPRAGLSVWRPYETLGIERQQAMLETAATALNLVRTGKVTARGSLAPLLSVQPHQHVYDGDQPSATELARRARQEAMHQSWTQAQQAIEDWFDTARSDPGTARQILGILTHYCRTQEAYDRERDFMTRQGIPACFLPDPEPGRFAPSTGVR
jgi:hypothetical protein